MGVHVGEVIALLVFYIIILVIGIGASWWKNRKRTDHEEGQAVSGTEQIIVARRDIGMIIGGFTMTATWVGGGYINGTAEVFFSQGLVWAQPPIGYTLSLVLGGLIFAKPMREKRYLTMLDPFQQKYGERIGGIMYIPAVIGELFWSAAILAALGASISVIMEFNFTVATIVSSSFAILYTVVGGLYSVTYTDMAQIILIIFGLVLSVPFAWHSPYVHLFDTEYFLNGTNSSQLITADSWIGTIPTDQIGVYIDGLLLLTLGGVPWNCYFQRVLCSKSANASRSLSLLGALGCLLFAIPSAMIGIIALYADWDAAGYSTERAKKEASMILPLVLQYLTPPAVAFFGLGAVSAAVMSSTDASILSASSMFVNNIYKAIFRQKASDKELIWLIRISIILIGCLACLLAISVHSVYALWVICSDLVYVILFPQLVCVLFCSFSNRYGALAGYIVGFVLRMIGGEPSLNIPALLHYPYYDHDAKVQLFPFKTLACICNLLTILIVSYVTQQSLQRRRVRISAANTNTGLHEMKRQYGTYPDVS